MNNTIYISRSKSMDSIEEMLIRYFKLELCLKNKTERIFKNAELLITCKNKYVSVLVYDEVYNKNCAEIINFLNTTEK